jgi:A/G-specific adenine glycosylase
LIHKRTQKGIWHNLYQFPLLETEIIETEENILALIKNQNFINNSIQNIQLFNPQTIVHKLSHQHLNIKFWKIKVNGKIENGFDWESVKKMPFPIVIFNFISNQ